MYVNRIVKHIVQKKMAPTTSEGLRISHTYNICHDHEISSWFRRKRSSRLISVDAHSISGCAAQHEWTLKSPGGPGDCSGRCALYFSRNRVRIMFKPPWRSGGFRRARAFLPAANYRIRSVSPGRCAAHPEQLPGGPGCRSWSAHSICPEIECACRVPPAARAGEAVPELEQKNPDTYWHRGQSW
jgi:hypothetical protein